MKLDRANIRTVQLFLVECAVRSWEENDLAEVKSLAVHPSAHGQGIGRQLVNAVVDEALRLRIQRVFSLTYEQAFFAKMGFTVVDRPSLPLKVWSDCIRCPKRLVCDEIAMVRTLLPAPALAEANPDTDAHLRYDVPTPLTQLRTPPSRS